VLLVVAAPTRSTTTSNAISTSQEATERHTVRVQLEHAETGKKGKQIYTIHTPLLVKLQSTTSTAAAVTNTDTTTNVLLTMLAPAGRLSTAEKTTATSYNDVKLLTYDGK
jgi:uncharacterized membrane protein